MDYKYQVIKLQNLQDRPQEEGKICEQNQLNKKLNFFYRWVNNECLFYSDSGISENRIIPDNEYMRTNSFFSAFVQAYIKHGDIVLVPDEVWLMIAFYVSQYIDQHSEKLRDKLASHEGKMNLVVVQQYQNQKGAEKNEKQWDKFFETILQLIRKNTKEGIVEAFQCNFSTTTKEYKIISTALIMKSLQKLFNYKRCFIVCGINNVYMAGVRDDWAKMIPKLKYMENFDVDGKLKEYITHMEIILKNFLQTFDNKPNVEWWNTVMKTPKSQKVYAGSEMQVQGWILHFFGIYNKKTMTSFPDLSIQVPIELVNQITQTKKNLVLVSDWVSISKLNDRAYKPDVALSIVVKNEQSLK